MKLTLKELIELVSKSKSCEVIETIELPLFSTFQATSFSAGGKMGLRRTQTLIG